MFRVAVEVDTTVLSVRIVGISAHRSVSGSLEGFRCDCDHCDLYEKGTLLLEFQNTSSQRSATSPQGNDLSRQNHVISS